MLNATSLSRSHKHISLRARVRPESTDELRSQASLSHTGTFPYAVELPACGLGRGSHLLAFGRCPTLWAGRAYAAARACRRVRKRSDGARTPASWRRVLHIKQNVAILMNKSSADANRLSCVRTSSRRQWEDKQLDFRCILVQVRLPRCDAHFRFCAAHLHTRTITRCE